MKNLCIPISAAKDVSEKFEFPEVAGNFLKKALGWPDEL